MPARVSRGPTVAALLALCATFAFLWWVVAGPRPPEAEIDRAALGFAVEERGPGPRPEFLTLRDPAAVEQAFAGQQGPLGGHLGEPHVRSDGSYSVPVFAGAEEGERLLDTTAVGVVEWDGVDADEGFRRCAFPEPVQLGAARDVAEEQDGEVTADALTAVGACDGDQAVLVIPLTRHLIADVGFMGGVIGREADAVDTPAGVVVLHGGGRVDVRAEAPAVDGPVYPRDVARQSLEDAFADNPNIGTGTWIEPVYPALVPTADGLWWAMPISPAGSPESITAYATVAADRLAADRLNPVQVHWLDDPDASPTLLTGRAERLLEDIDPQAAAEEPSVYLALPDARGVWHGRVARPAPEPAILYFLDIRPDGTVCLSDVDGVEAGCRAPDDD